MIKLYDKITKEVVEAFSVFKGEHSDIWATVWNGEKNCWDRIRANDLIPADTPAGKAFIESLATAKAPEQPTCPEVREGQSTWKRIIEIVVEQLGVNPSQVEPDTNFIEDLGADSLDFVELWMAFEEEYGLSIPEEEAGKCQTARLVARCLYVHGVNPILIPAHGTVAAEFLGVKQFKDFKQ